MRTLLFCTSALMALTTHATGAEKADVIETYMAIAEAGYADSLTTAKHLNAAVDALLAAPSDQTLAAARAAWLDARVPYQQTEVYRFGNAIVDDWEGKVNAWPLDEGLIDYVDGDGASDENPYGALNIIATPALDVSGRKISAEPITASLIQDLHELDEIEANVTTGYHAIEFLLWGQDLNGTGPGAGNRPASDFDTTNCSNGNCDRRAAYLKVATALLISDLEDMAKAWAEGGDARAELEAKGEDGAIISMLTGMGSLSYGEQAGERMKLGLLLNDPEEEHDCFSDNTHNSHYYDGLGVQNVYNGTYKRIDGSTVSGPALSDLVATVDPGTNTRMEASVDATMAALGALKTAAESGMSYDQMLAADNEKGGALIQAAIDALVAQTREIERVVAVLKLEPIAFEGSDSLDNPGAVFQ